MGLAERPSAGRPDENARLAFEKILAGAWIATRADNRCRSLANQLVSLLPALIAGVH